MTFILTVPTIAGTRVPYGGEWRPYEDKGAADRDAATLRSVTGEDVQVETSDR